MQSEGVPESTIKQWIAVSAFETNGWTSRVFRDSNNLFNVILPQASLQSEGLTKLTYGEGQTIFPDLASSVKIGLFKHVIQPFKYPLQFSGINSQVDFMKSKGYFTYDLQAYKDGVIYWYDKLFPNG
jgi:hypothetical protein